MCLLDDEIGSIASQIIQTRPPELGSSNSERFQDPLMTPVLEPSLKPNLRCISPFFCCSLLVSELLAGLHKLAEIDNRLQRRLRDLEAAQNLRKGLGGNSGRASTSTSAGRLQELLCQPRLKGLLKLRDSNSRNGATNGSLALSLFCMCTHPPIGISMLEYSHLTVICVIIDNV